MENGKVHNHQVMQWKFKQGNSAKVTFYKICSVFDEERITGLTVRKWFAKSRSRNMTLHGELSVGRNSEFNDNFLKAIFEQNPRQARDIGKGIYTS